MKIEKIPSGRSGMDTMKITGFREGELFRLKNLPHEESKQILLDLLDEQNNGIATCWHNGNGIYGLWYDNEAAYLNIGSSCD